MQQRQLQKSIHPRAAGRWWEAGRGSGRGNGPGRKGIQVSPGTRLANARKELQKNLRSFQTHWCLKSILVSGRFCRTCTRDKNPDSSDRRGCGQGSWQAGPASPGRGWRGAREGVPGGLPAQLAPPGGGPTLHSLQQPSVWQEMVERGVIPQKWSCSGPLAGRLSCGRGCCLRKPRRRGASGEDVLCRVFASGMMNKGKRTEKRLH